MLSRYILFFLNNRLLSWLLLFLIIAWGLSTAPFSGIKKWTQGWLPDHQVSVDAIPDIGENQQIVFTEWEGRSPQDVEDQLTFPLTTSLLGIPGVKSIRSTSMFGFSSIYVIFQDDVDFYWSRSRILEKLNSLPANLLPDDVQPSLGPDATALGQIFWYTLEGRDGEGNPTGGWNPQELRSIQDFYVRYSLSSAEGVAEVASIGGYVKEYQVDVDPEAMKTYGVTLNEVMEAVKNSNLDVGAQTLEINKAEYFVRGLGYVKEIADIEESVIQAERNVPIRIKDIAKVHLGPANRRGILDKSGAEAVGGVVVARYGANPSAVIQSIKAKVKTLAPGLPSKTLADGTLSQVSIIPFYDRSKLIQESIGTLETALQLEIWITILVIFLMLRMFTPSFLVAGTLPVAVLICFIAMKYVEVDANIVALAGIAIAIGTIVDMGIVLVENITQKLSEQPSDSQIPLKKLIYEASMEVSSAILTAVATTIISFLPVFTMEGAEGKLFQPLAYTKTFTLIASIVIVISFLPALAYTFFSIKLPIFRGPFIPVRTLRVKYPFLRSHLPFAILTLLITFFLTRIWMPLGVSHSLFLNILFVASLLGVFMGFFSLIIKYYEVILRRLLKAKLLFLLTIGLMMYVGYRVFQSTESEFMPALDEGTFLLMPTTMPHAGMEENTRNLRLLDMAVTAIPEVEMVVGKAGRVESALDPAPMSMYENVIQYKSEYKTDAQGYRLRFAYDYDTQQYLRDEEDRLIPDPGGRYFRQWRDHIQSPDDIWQEILNATHFPGITSAPKLQPIETRLVMLQTGMRSPMGIKISGSDLDKMEQFGQTLENHIREVAGIQAATVFSDRILGKPYLLIDIDREAISRYGLSIADVQQHIRAAVGGIALSTTVEGRERYAIRVRYPRELRNNPEKLERIYLSTSDGSQIPLGALVNIRYEQGPQSIKSEDGFLVSYVLFDKEEGYAEGEVVENVQEYLNQQQQEGSLIIPEGISYRFAGTYEQQLRANKRLSIVLPIAFVLIFIILYLHFRSVSLSLMVFLGVFVAFAGGFILLGLYGQSWFLNFSLGDIHLRDLFQIQPINLSVAVWVGFLALFGIATDDGVLVGTYLQASFQRNRPQTIEDIHEAVVEGGLKRIRPAMMTTATTIIALLPILTSTGRGSDIMLPMAIPTVGGMLFQTLTMFTVPILFALWKEWQLRFPPSFHSSSNGLKT